MEETSHRYRTWAALAGYFDGDGDVDIGVGQFVVTIVIGFTDNWEAQLLGVREFLGERGVKSGAVTVRRFHGEVSAWCLRVSNVAGVVRAARFMLPHACKKRSELKAVVDYLEDRITGDNLVAVMNQEVEIGNRIGKPRVTRNPWSRDAGMKLKYAFSLERAHAATRIEVPDEVRKKILAERLAKGTSLRGLSDGYGYSIGVIERILREG